MNAPSPLPEIRAVRIVNRHGLHARPASEFVKLAGRFPCAVYLSRDGLEVNGKSIMGVLMLAAEMGTELRIRCEGEGAADAADALAGLIGNGFGEGTP